MALKPNPKNTNLKKYKLLGCILGKN